MPAFIRSNIRTILPLLQQQLMTFTGFPAERVVIQKEGASLEMPASLQGDQVIVLKLANESVRRRQVQSAGRHDDRIERAIDVGGFSRLNLDEAYQDQTWLLETTLGYLPFEDAMLNSLVCFIPMNGGGDVLSEPCRVDSISAPATHRDDWGSAAVRCWFTLYRNLNQAVIFPGAQ